ncbi:MAG: hypothetical protein JST83_18500 [Bacteroidetes bacterium]|nr:hypothetical protein [Bacteroidota bacterium]
MYRKVLRFYLWATLGLCTEIFFTAFTDLFNALSEHKAPDWSLTGHTYVWMIFIYGAGSVIFPFGHHHLKGFHLLLRIFIVAVGIFAIEFTSGFILDKILGRCPWQYSGPFSILGYIRLDYLPAWMIFAYMIERADEIFDRMAGTFEG